MNTLWPHTLCAHSVCTQYTALVSTQSSVNHNDCKPSKYASVDICLLTLTCNNNRQFHILMCHIVAMHCKHPFDRAPRLFESSHVSSYHDVLMRTAHRPSSIKSRAILIAAAPEILIRPPSHHRASQRWHHPAGSLHDALLRLVPDSDDHSISWYSDISII